MPAPTRSLPLLALGFGLFASCLGPEPDRVTNYYAVELTTTAPTDAARASQQAVRIRQLSAAGHLREPMCVRTSAVAYRFLDADRWTEAPLGYVAAALDQALFESGAFARAEGGEAAALDVDLRAFERRQEGSTREAVCTLAAQLTAPGGKSLLDRSFEARVPLANDSAEELARGLGVALREAVQALAQALASAGA